MMNVMAALSVCSKTIKLWARRHRSTYYIELLYAYRYNYDSVFTNWF